MMRKDKRAPGRNREASRRGGVLRRGAVAAIAAAMAVMVCMPAFAAEAGAAPRTYKVRIYAGQRGRIDGGEVRELNVAEGERVNFYQGDVSLSDGKYYVKGIRESGKDNKEANASFAVTKDMDYVVAYGILGDSVAYTVNYLDGEGNELLPGETFYGNVGDAPVIAYRYIEGWQPQAYNLTGTLSDNAAENVFNFVYTQTAGAGAEAAGEAGTAGGTAAAGGGAGAGAPGGAVVPDEATPQDLQNLDDEQTPLANIGNGIRSLIDPDGDGILVNIPKPVVCTGVAVAAFLLFLIVMWSRKKKKEYRIDE